LNEVVETISAEIKDRGIISFARFMDLALYCPIYGYYEKQQDNIGRRGDFYTSVSVGPVFGKLLAYQFAEWVKESHSRELRAGSRHGGLVQIVEAGAHRGDLANDILTWFREYRPDLWPALEYWILEPSSSRKACQQQKLRDFPHKVRWFKDWTSIHSFAQDSSSPATHHSSRFFRIIFSNELLDSFPVHRLGWDATKRAWFEWGVILENGRFVWARMEDPCPVAEVESERLLASERWQLMPLLPDGFTTEVSPAAVEWWRQAANALQCGKLLTFDYGLAADEFLTPHRTEGTLRAYHKHAVSADVLASPGDHDLTAHVNFTRMQETGEAAGLNTEAFVSQSQFLTTIATRLWSKSPPTTSKQIRQFQTLVHPDHLGRAFKVLIQERGR
jgi:SAM-dependent MidA family methyltransferase